MQTDPNWANFLYNPETGQLGLLDFGATRHYRPGEPTSLASHLTPHLNSPHPPHLIPGFVNTYYKIIEGAVRQDRQAVLEHSRELGFLTGAESKTMNEAHVESVMLLARPFHRQGAFCFASQTITAEIQALSSVMLRERLVPPPPEVYSLHRKMSGLFLLAGKLEASFDCQQIWRDVQARWRPFPEDHS